MSSQAVRIFGGADRRALAVVLLLLAPACSGRQDRRELRSAAVGLFRTAAEGDSARMARFAADPATIGQVTRMSAADPSLVRDAAETLEIVEVDRSGEVLLAVARLRHCGAHETVHLRFARDGSAWRVGSIDFPDRDLVGTTDACGHPI